MLTKSVLIALAILLLACSIVLAQVPPSGWPECRLGTADYNQAQCIARAERWKGVQAPYDFATTEAEAIELYNWAGAEPHPLSPCTQIGVGGELLPDSIKALCEEYGTPTPQPPIVTPTPTDEPFALPTMAEPPDPPNWSRSWLPIVWR